LCGPDICRTVSQTRRVAAFEQGKHPNRSSHLGGTAPHH
jgi:hypothetical protein